MLTPCADSNPLLGYGSLQEENYLIHQPGYKQQKGNSPKNQRISLRITPLRGSIYLDCLGLLGPKEVNHPFFPGTYLDLPLHSPKLKAKATENRPK